MSSLRSDISNSEKLVSKDFEVCLETGWYTLKFLMFDHLAKDVHRFEVLMLLQSSEIEYISVQIISTYLATTELHTPGWRRRCMWSRDAKGWIGFHILLPHRIHLLIVRENMVVCLRMVRIWWKG